MTEKLDNAQEPYVSSTDRSAAEKEESPAVPGVVTHDVNRLVIEVTESFDGFRERYEQAVPKMEPHHLADLIQRQAPWSEVLADADATAPHGFVIYFSWDFAPLMALAGDRGRCVMYRMGNHTIAERMYRHDPAVMLYAPLRTALCDGADGQTRFVIDQPSTLFASFGVPEIAAVGVELDRKLIGLLEALGAPVPAGLRES
jgi:Domain of unknown function DUF302